MTLSPSESPSPQNVALCTHFYSTIEAKNGKKKEVFKSTKSHQSEFFLMMRRPDSPDNDSDSARSKVVGRVPPP